MSLQFDGVERAFGSQKVLSGLDLHVPDGACYGFLGGNGAGKTTSMRIALGLLAPSKGRVLVDGLDVAAHPTAARARTAGLIEQPGFFSGLSARRNLARLARLAGVPASDRSREIARWLEIVGLADHARRPAGVFSQGMRQRLGLAQALIGGARNILLDEPMNGLDPAGIAEIRQVLRRLVDEEGRTLLVSSHQLKELEGLCDHCGILHRGRIALEGPTPDLLREVDPVYELQVSGRLPEDEVLTTFGTPVEGVGTHDGVQLRLGSRAPEEVLAGLIGAGARVRSFAPTHRDLEAVYLDAVRRADAGEEPRRLAIPEASGESVEVRAPRRPLLRALGYELRRTLLGWRTLALLILPAGIAFFSVRSFARETRAAGEAGSFGGGGVEVPSAFEAVGVGLSSALPFLVTLLVAFASLAVTTERAQGTLKNLVTAPVRRWHAALAKIAILLFKLTLGYGLVLAAACLTAGAHFDWAAPRQMMPGGLMIDLAPVEELEAAFSEVFWRPLLPIGALVGFGWLCGAIVSRAITALAIALLGTFLMEVSRVGLRPEDLEYALPVAYVPSFFANTSWLDYYVQVVRGAGDAVFGLESTAQSVPLVTLCLTFLLGTFAFLVRRVR